MFDENLAHISTWLYQTEIRLDEMEKMPAAEKERMMKVKTHTQTWLFVSFVFSVKVNIQQ